MDISLERNSNLNDGIIIRLRNITNHFPPEADFKLNDTVIYSSFGINVVECDPKLQWRSKNNDRCSCFGELFMASLSFRTVN